MPARFTLRSLLLSSTVAAIACGWAVDHYRLASSLKTQIETAELRETRIKNGVRTVVDATETWLVAEAHKDASPDEFRKILVYNRLFDLWQLSENETDVNALGGVPADYWAYKILINLGCDDVDDIFEIALSLDQYDNVPDETYIAGTPEHKTYRQFIEKAFAENSEPKETGRAKD